MKTKTSLTVSIDLKDEYEREIFEYVMSKGPRKKSGFIKRVLYAHKHSIKEVATTVHVDVDAAEDKNAMQSFF